MKWVFEWVVIRPFMAIVFPLFGLVGWALIVLWHFRFKQANAFLHECYEAATDSFSMKI